MKSTVQGTGRRFSARAVAISVLARMRQTDGYLNVVLDSALDEYRFDDARDAGFVTELCYGTTRREMSVDATLLLHVDRKLAAIEDKVLAALRIGVYQLKFLKTPAHAAVGDTVDALKQVGLDRAAGFVNAILRKVARSQGEAVENESPAVPQLGDIATLSIETSHPEWLVRRWQKQFGVERAKAMLDADNEAPPLVIRANTAKQSRDVLLGELREVGVQATATKFSSTGISLSSPGKIDALYGYREGLWQVQDEAAQLVTEYAQIPESARVLDLCAAPGGKTCHLAADHQVVSADLYKNKMHLIDAEVRRLQLQDNVRLEDADA
jgi:16S rRNA (cytosine967-C5)-methyltransferase